MYGIYFNQEPKEYFGAKGLNASTMKQLSVSEPYFLASYQGKIPGKDSIYRRRGRAYHCLLMEGLEAYESAFVVQPKTYMAAPDKKGEEPKEKPWNNNANVCKDWHASIAAQGKQVIDADNDALIRDAAAWVPEDLNPFRGGRPEVAIYWEEFVGGVSVQCKAGIDYLAPTHVADLKTASHSMGKNASRIVADKALYEQHNLQCAWYQRGIRVLQSMIGSDADCHLQTDDDQEMRRILPGDKQFFFFYQFMQSGCPEFFIREMRQYDYNEETFLPWQEANQIFDEALRMAADSIKGNITPESLCREREMPSDGVAKNRIFTNADFKKTNREI